MAKRAGLRVRRFTIWRRVQDTSAADAAVDLREACRLSRSVITSHTAKSCVLLAVALASIVYALTGSVRQTATGQVQDRLRTDSGVVVSNS